MNILLRVFVDLFVVFTKVKPIANGPERIKTINIIVTNNASDSITAILSTLIAVLSIRPYRLLIRLREQLFGEASLRVRILHV